jgi:hypothetical protein
VSIVNEAPSVYADFCKLSGHKANFSKIKFQLRLDINAEKGSQNHSCWVHFCSTLAANNFSRRLLFLVGAGTKTDKLLDII